MQTQQIVILICIGLGMFAIIGGVSLLANYYTLNGIKSKTVGDGQHGTARFATEKEIRDTYKQVPYEPERWRRGEALPTEQGLVVGYKKRGTSVTALVDSGDIHCLMIGAAGVGKTANFLYPNIEYACASGMSWLCTDTKGDLFRNYAGIAKDCYGYQISVLDLRNPTRSDGDNILTLVNKYMDEYLAHPENLAAKAKAEKYAKITAKTIICSDGAEASSYGQNAFFYDAAEGLLASVILLIAEFCPTEKRHIISVFKLIQDLLAPSPVKNRSLFQLLMDKLPPTHKAKWFAGAALNSADQPWLRCFPQPCPGSMPFWIRKWSRSCALTVRWIRKPSAPASPPSSLCCRKKITQSTSWCLCSSSSSTGRCSPLRMSMVASCPTGSWYLRMKSERYRK